MSRIGRAIVELVFRGDAVRVGTAQAKAQLGALATENRVVSSASQAASGSLDRVGSSAEKSAISAHKSADGLEKIAKAAQGLGRPGLVKGLDEVGNRIGGLPGKLLTFGAQATAVAGTAVAFYELGKRIREAFDPADRADRFQGAIKSMISSVRELRESMLFNRTTAGLDDFQRQVLEVRQRTVDAIRKAEEDAQGGAMSPDRIWRILRGEATWSGREEEDAVRRESQRLKNEEAKTLAALFKDALDKFNKDLAATMQKNSDEQRRYTEQLLGQIAVSAESINQVVGIRMRAPVASVAATGRAP